MNALYDLKDMLCEQLEEYGKRGELSASVLDRVDKLAHAAKNLDKVIECYEGDSGMENGNSRRSRSSGISHSRSSRRRGRSYNSGYSGNDGIVDQLYSMMDEAEDDQTRQEIQKFASKMEQM